MRDIAKASNVGLSNLYNYYENKDDIFKAVVKPIVKLLFLMLEEHHGTKNQDISLILSEAYFQKSVNEYVIIIKRNRRLRRMLFFNSFVLFFVMIHLL